MIYFSGKIPIVLDFLARDIANHLYALDTPFDRRIKPFEYWNPTYHYCHLIDHLYSPDYFAGLWTGKN